jgi:hypothetical protein
LKNFEDIEEYVVMVEEEPGTEEFMRMNEEGEE